MYRVTYRAALQIQKRIKELWFSPGGGEVSSRKGFPLQQQQPGHAGCLLSTLGILKLTQTLGGIIKMCGAPLPETSLARFDWSSRMLDPRRPSEQVRWASCWCRRFEQLPEWNAFGSSRVKPDQSPPPPPMQKQHQTVTGWEKKELIWKNADSQAHEWMLKTWRQSWCATVCLGRLDFWVVYWKLKTFKVTVFFFCFFFIFLFVKGNLTSGAAFVLLHGHNNRSSGLWKWTISTACSPAQLLNVISHGISFSKPSSM